MPLNLFQSKVFESHAGKTLRWKMECDALSKEDLETIADEISYRLKFSRVHGIPRGGVRLANALAKYITPDTNTLLIVDDVFTTGKSMLDAAYNQALPGEDYVGVVIMSRSVVVPDWVKPWLTLNSFFKDNI